MRVYFRHGKGQPFAVSRQRVEVIYRIFGCNLQFCLHGAIVNRLGTHDNIAVARAVGTDMESRSSLFPSTVVPLDFYRSKGSEGDAEGIYNIDILALIDHIHWGIPSAGDEAPEVILLQSVVHVGFVLVINGTCCLYARITDILKTLLQTVVRVEAHLLIFGNDLIRIRVEIDGVVIQFHHRHQLFANEFGPYRLLYIFVMVNTENDLIGPRRSGIRDHDIMLIRHANTGNLENGGISLGCFSIKLIISRVIFHVGHIAVGALNTLNVTSSISMQIMGGEYFGVLHIRYGIIRPPVATIGSR